MSYYEALNSSLFQDQDLINELIKTAQDPKAMQIAGRLAAVLKEQMMEPGKQVELANNVVLDKVPQIFDLKNPNPGNIALYVGNLKSAADFRQWLANNNIVIMTDKGRSSTINERGNFDQNAAVQYIYDRALYDSKIYVPENKTKAFTYLNKVKAIASELQYNLTGSTQAQPQPAASSTDMGQLVKEIVALRPFNSEYINTSVLSDFANKFAQLKPGIAGQASQLTTSISKANQMMDSSNIFRMTNLNLKTLNYQYPQIDMLVPLLLKIVASAGTLYQQFSTEPNLVELINSPANEAFGGMNAIRQQAIPLRTNLNELTQLNQDVIAAKQKRGF
jgi:hypothetical protein